MCLAKIIHATERCRMNNFQAMAQIMTPLNEDGLLKPGSHEYIAEPADSFRRNEWSLCGGIRSLMDVSSTPWANTARS